MDGWNMTTHEKHNPFQPPNLQSTQITNSSNYPSTLCTIRESSDKRVVKSPMAFFSSSKNAISRRNMFSNWADRSFIEIRSPTCAVPQNCQEKIEEKIGGIRVIGVYQWGLVTERFWVSYNTNVLCWMEDVHRRKEKWRGEERCSVVKGHL